MNTKNAELIQGLRGLLAFVEANDDFEFVPGTDTDIVQANFHAWYLHTGDEERRIAIANLTRRMARVGKAEKLYTDAFAHIRLDFGRFVKFQIGTLRETVCERVIVGKKLIAAQPERVIAATPEQTVDEVEWRCHPVMTAGSSHVIDGDTPALSAPETPQLEAESLVDIPF